VPFTLEEVRERIDKRRLVGKNFSIIVVSEGARPEGQEAQFTRDQKKDPFVHVRLGGVGIWLAERIEEQTGYETRVTHLGHLQRGGSPTVFDRVLATRLGAFAVDMVIDGTFDHMACMRDNRVVAVPYAEALDGTKTVDLELYKMAKLIF
jgi:6-phosphofructokinase 1